MGHRRHFGPTDLWRGFVVAHGLVFSGPRRHLPPPYRLEHQTTHGHTDMWMGVVWVPFVYHIVYLCATCFFSSVLLYTIILLLMFFLLLFYVPTMPPTLWIRLHLPITADFNLRCCRNHVATCCMYYRECNVTSPLFSYVEILRSHLPFRHFRNIASAP